MANPCVVTFRGKEYTYEEWVEYLALDGGLDQLISEGLIKDIGKIPSPKQRVEVKTREDVENALIGFGMDKAQARDNALLMEAAATNAERRYGVSKEGFMNMMLVNYEKGKEGLEQVEAYQGSPHKFNKELLVSYPDGRTEYLVGTPDEFPKVPQGATIVKEFPLGRMRTEKIGTGEGAQAFGWGLYFTDLESIARDYATKLAKYEVIIDGKPYYESPFWKLATNLAYNPKSWVGMTKEDIINEIKQDTSIDKKTKEELLADLEKVKSIKIDANRNLIKTTLHKGKTPDQYTWLEWDKPVSKKTVSNLLSKLNIEKSGLYVDFLETKEKQEKVNAEIRELEKEGNKIINDNKATNEEISEYLNRIRNKRAELKYTEINQKAADLSSQLKETRLGRDFLEIVEKGLNGGDFYKFLEGISPEWKEGVSYDFNDQRGAKWASLFLLENGIDGIKYPAESISRGATSDTARGFNYVVFDENAITIEEASLFQQARGRFSIENGKDVIGLFNSSNASTFPHELGHKYLQTIVDLATTNEQARKDLETLIDEYRKAGKSKLSAEDLFKQVTSTDKNVMDNSQYRAVHEYFSTGFERWLREGDKAGFSDKMVELFERFAEYLKNVYLTIKGTNLEGVKLTPELNKFYSELFGADWPVIKEQENQAKEDIKNSQVAEADKMKPLSVNKLTEFLKSKTDPNDFSDYLKNIISYVKGLKENNDTDQFTINKTLFDTIDKMDVPTFVKENAIKVIEDNADEIKKAASIKGTLREGFKNAMMSDALTEAEKKKIRQGDAVTYVKVSLNKLNKTAAELIKDLTFDELYEANKEGALVIDFKNDEALSENVSLLANIIGKGRNEMKNNPTPERKAELEAKLADLQDRMDVFGTIMGKGLSAMKLLSKVDPKWFLNKLKKEYRKELPVNVKEKVDRLITELKQKVKELDVFNTDLLFENANKEKLLAEYEKKLSAKGKIAPVKSVSIKAESQWKRDEMAAARQAKKGNLELLKKIIKPSGLNQSENNLSADELIEAIARDTIEIHIQENKKGMGIDKFVESMQKDLDGYDYDYTSLYLKLSEELKGKYGADAFNTAEEIEAYYDSSQSELTDIEIKLGEAEVEEEAEKTTAEKATELVAKRIQGDITKQIKGAKEKTALQKLVEIYLDDYREKTKEKRAKSGKGMSTKEMLADALDISLNENRGEIFANVKEQINKYIDSRNWTDAEKDKAREFIKDYQNSIFKSLVTAKVGNKVLSDIVIKSGYSRTQKVDGVEKVYPDWKGLVTAAKTYKAGVRRGVVDEITKVVGNSQVAEDVFNHIMEMYDSRVTKETNKYVAREIAKMAAKRNVFATPRRVTSKLNALMRTYNALDGIGNDTFRDFFADEFGLNFMTAEQEANLERLLEKMQVMPEGYLKNEAAEAVTSYVEYLKSPGKFVANTVFSNLYGAVLAHPSTSIINAYGLPATLFWLKTKALFTGDKFLNKVINESMQSGVWKATFKRGIINMPDDYYTHSDLKYRPEETMHEFLPTDLDVAKQLKAGKIGAAFRSMFLNWSAQGFRSTFKKPDASKLTLLKGFARANEATDALVQNVTGNAAVYDYYYDKLRKEGKSRKEAAEQAYKLVFPKSETELREAVSLEFLSQGIPADDTMVNYRVNEMQRQARDPKVNEMAKKIGEVAAMRNAPNAGLDAGFFENIAWLVESSRKGTMSTSKDNASARAMISATKFSVAPFVRTVGHVLDRSLDATGLGFARGLYRYVKNVLLFKSALETDVNKGKLTKEEAQYIEAYKAMRSVKDAFTGIAILGALMAYAYGSDDDDDGFYGENPDATEYEKKNGFKNCVVINGVKIPLAYLGTLAIPASLIGNAMDQLRKQKKFGPAIRDPKKMLDDTGFGWSEFLINSGKSLTSLSFLNGFRVAISTDYKGEGKVGNYAATTMLGAFGIPHRVLKDIYQGIDPTIKVSDSFGSGIMKAAPYLSILPGVDKARPMYDYRGRELRVGERPSVAWSSMIDQFAKQPSDALDMLLYSTKYLSPNINKSAINYSKIAGAGQVDTPSAKELYDIYKEVGKRFDLKLREKGVDELNEMKDAIQKVVIKSREYEEIKSQFQYEYERATTQAKFNKEVNKIWKGVEEQVMGEYGYSRKAEKEAMKEEPDYQVNPSWKN